MCKNIAFKEKLHTDVQVLKQLVLDQSEEILITKSITIKHQYTFYKGINILKENGFIGFLATFAVTLKIKVMAVS